MSIMQEYVSRSNSNPFIYQKNKEIEDVSKMNYRWKKLADETIKRNKILNRNMKLKDKIIKMFFKSI